MKKIIIFLLILSITLLVLTGCNSNNKTSSSTNYNISSSSSFVASSNSGNNKTEISNEASKSGAGNSNTTSSVDSTPQAVTLTFPEGFTAPQIGARLEAHGVCTKSEFLSTINSYDFSYYPLVNAISKSSKYCYKLEGYLYPSTYTFSLNMKPQDVIGKFLRASETNIGSNYSFSGMTTNQLIILASMIQKESGKTSEMTKISSVFHNRLKAGMRLQSDPTRNYVNDYLTPKYAPFYNTYKCAALPAGAICNPGAAALSAAANPTSTSYLYFCVDSKDNYYYATTLAEHDANLVKCGISVGGNSN